MAEDVIIPIMNDVDIVIPVGDYVDIIAMAVEYVADEYTSAGSASAENTIPVLEAGAPPYGIMTEADKAKLDALTVSGAMNVQADWLETDLTKWEYIKNKPSSANFIGPIGPQGAVGPAGLTGPPGPAGSTDTNFNNPLPVPSTLGGIDAGSTFNNVPVSAVIDQLLYPYQYPLFTSFSFPQTRVLEVGDEVPAGNKTFSWTTSNSANISADDISILGVSGLPANGAISIPISAESRTNPDMKIWTISGINTAGGGFNRNFSVQWYWAIYFGASPIVVEMNTEILNLDFKSLSNTANGIYNMPAGNYKYICYPVSFGLRTNFRDTSTGFDVSMMDPITIMVENIFGITTDYYVHRTINKLGAAISIAVS